MNEEKKQDKLERGDYLEIENLDLKLKLVASECQQLQNQQRELSAHLRDKYHLMPGDSLGPDGEIKRAPAQPKPELKKDVDVPADGSPGNEAAKD
jgi:hypothetical protein